MMTLKGKKQYLPLMQPFLIWLLLAAVFMLTAAPVVCASLSQNRVGGYHTFLAGRTGAEPDLNAEPHRVYSTFSYDFAPGSPVASKKGFRDMMSPEEAARYDKFWTKKAPTESTPYSTYRRYTPDGKIKQVTTYDKYGNRKTQFDLKDKYGRDPHRHDFKYDEKHPRPSYGARDKDHNPLDNIPDY